MEVKKFSQPEDFLHENTKLVLDELYKLIFKLPPKGKKLYNYDPKGRRSVVGRESPKPAT